MAICAMASLYIVLLRQESFSLFFSKPLRATKLLLLLSDIDTKYVQTCVKFCDVEELYLR